MDGLYQHHPCKDCPFRKDCPKGWLDRIEEIVECTSFVCHKTTEQAGYSNRPVKQCAGHMLLLEHKNEFWLLAKLMRINLKLRGREKIFDTVEDCVKHHKGIG